MAKYIDFEEVVAESITAIGAEGDDEIAKNFARTWIYRGLQELGSSDEQITVCAIYPKNLLLKKPKDLKTLIDVALYDEQHNLIPHKWHDGKKRIFPQTDGITFIVDDETQFFGPVDLSEDATNIVIGTNGTNVSYALVRYWQYPIDSNGLPMIREDEVEALSMYVRYRHSLRKNQNQSEIRENKLEWFRLADRCRAMKKAVTNEQAKTITSILNRQIPNFNKSTF
jgi:hypothetical protein